MIYARRRLAMAIKNAVMALDLDIDENDQPMSLHALRMAEAWQSDADIACVAVLSVIADRTQGMWGDLAPYKMSVAMEESVRVLWGAVNIPGTESLTAAMRNETARAVIASDIDARGMWSQFCGAPRAELFDDYELVFCGHLSKSFDLRYSKPGFMSDTVKFTAPDSD